MAKDKKDPAFLFYSKDWLEGTAELLPAEKGVYVDLLCHQHQKGSLPTETFRLARIVGLSHNEFTKIWDGIKSKFEPNGDRLVNRKLSDVMTERLEKGNKNKVIGTFASLLRLGEYTAHEHKFLKASFKVDNFLTETNQSVTERLTEWINQRLKSIENANEDVIEDKKRVKTLGTGKHFILITPQRPGSEKLRIHGEGGLQEFFEANGSILREPEQARKFMFSNTGKPYNDFRHLFNDYKNFCLKQLG